MRWICLCVGFMVFVSGFWACKPVPPTQSLVGDGSVPTGVDSTYYFPNDIQVRVGRRGEIFEGVWDNVPVIFLAGLWIGAQQRGVPRGNMVWVGSIPTSNFTARWNNNQVGVYHFGHDQAFDLTYPWPVSYGAPTGDGGTRLLYGDTMTWSALQSEFGHNIGVLSAPIEGVRVTHSVFGYRRSDLRNALFVRYDIKNESNVQMSDLHVGYYSDTDLANPLNNAVGYDDLRGMTYTYTPEPADGFTLYYVAGYAFLDVPQSEFANGVTAHRAIWKDFHPRYSELDFVSPSHVLTALQGRDNNGASMVDPVTGNETRYAFSGDPVAKTGWVDEARDVRSLLSAGPYALSSNQEIAVTVVWVVDRDRSLIGALNKVRVKLDQIRIENHLWRF